MSESRYRLLAIAATVSVASSLVATSAAEPEKDVPASFAKPTLLAQSKLKDEIDVSLPPSGAKARPAPSPKDLSSSDKSVPLKSDGAARTKTDKR